MVRARKCSYCGNLGHNARTCKRLSQGQLKLFGVQLDVSSLTSSNSSSPPSYSAMKTSFSTSSIPSSSPSLLGANQSSDSYLVSVNSLLSRNRDTRKGLPWTEEEQWMFVVGVEKLGKGNWRGISRNFVTTRTPTQVASYAQKYFLRQSAQNTFNRTKHISTSTSCTLQSVPPDLELKLAITLTPLELADAGLLT